MIARDVNCINGWILKCSWTLRILGLCDWLGGFPNGNISAPSLPMTKGYIFFWNTVYHNLCVEIQFIVLSFKVWLPCPSTTQHTLEVLSKIPYLLWSSYKLSGVPVMAQQKRIWLVSMRTQVRSQASVSGLRIRCCRELWSKSQTRLRSGVAVAVV